MIALQDKEAFARGGNRLCFVHPEFADRCIKVRRPDRSLEWRRAKKSFPKNLRPLSAFDDNLEELQVMERLQSHYPDALFKHVSRCYGMLDTDMGPGLCSELILDGDGEISRSLKLELWHGGYQPDLQRAVAELMAHWRDYAVPSKDLLIHNIVVQRDQQGAIQRLVVIDGMGASGLAGKAWAPLWLRRYFAGRKANNLPERIDEFLAQIQDGNYPGLQGVPLKDGEPNIPPPKQDTPGVAKSGARPSPVDQDKTEP